MNEQRESEDEFDNSSLQYQLFGLAKEYVTKHYELPGPTENYETLKSEPPLVAEGDIGNPIDFAR